MPHVQQYTSQEDCNTPRYGASMHKRGEPLYLNPASTPANKTIYRVRQDNTMGEQQPSTLTTLSC